MLCLRDAIGEVNRDTGAVPIDKYIIAHNYAIVVNPKLVEGQVMDGILRGAIAYEEARQRLTGSLMNDAPPAESGGAAAAA